MKEKFDIYVCYTVMHLYVSILKAFNTNQRNNILILTDHINNYKYFAHKLNKLQIFYKILIIEDKKLNYQFKKNKLNFIFYKRNLIKFFNTKTCLKDYLKDYEIGNIFLFLDEPRTSQYLMLMGNNVILIEDGIGIYANEKFNFKNIFKTILGIPKIRGKDKRIKIVEATMPEKLPKGIRKKGILLNLSKLQSKLNEIQKKQIFNIFFNENFSIENKKNVLILTQPFSEDLCISEKHKVNLYTKIIKKYIKEYNIYIKPHPRELTNYKKEINYEFIEIHRNFPIELFNLMNFIKFDKIITINSSSINNINCCNEKILLGLEFDKELLTNYRKRFNVK